MAREGESTTREYIPLDDLAPKSFRERYLVSVDILKIVVESLHRYTSIPDIYIFFLGYPPQLNNSIFIFIIIFHRIWSKI